MNLFRKRGRYTHTHEEEKTGMHCGCKFGKRIVLLAVPSFFLLSIFLPNDAPLSHFFTIRPLMQPWTHWRREKRLLNRRRRWRRRRRRRQTDGQRRKIPSHFPIFASLLFLGNRGGKKEKDEKFENAPLHRRGWLGGPPHIFSWEGRRLP